MNIKTKINSFQNNGYVIFKNLIKKSFLDKINNNKLNYFKLKYPINIYPDKIKWIYKRSEKKLVRSQCNLWRSDINFAKISLSKQIGKIAAKLMHWEGTRLNQDSLIWVIPKTGGVTFHQDNPYQDWNTPGKIMTCWIPLRKTTANGGTLEYIVGSHKWEKGGTFKNFFSRNYDLEIKKRFKKRKIEINKILLNKGDVVFHHGNMWHGSGINRSKVDRVSISIHLMDCKSKFHKKKFNPIFSRYKKFNSLEMDESFFPIIWHSKNKISKFIKSYLKK